MNLLARVLLSLLTAAAPLATAVLGGSFTARADAVAYLVNVTVRPGYHFANAADALAYGHGICGGVSAGHVYQRIVADVKDDIDTNDDYQASYLISQAVGELCPSLIWRLRSTAAHYRPTAVGQH